MSTTLEPTKAYKTDAGKGSYGICRIMGNGVTGETGGNGLRLQPLD